MFSISLSDDDLDDGACEGAITLGAHKETFVANLGSFSRSDYERQWRDAISWCLNRREPAALFKSVDVRPGGVGTLWLYPLVPSEWAGDTTARAARLSNFPEPRDAGMYVTERFMAVTIDVSNFNRRVYEEYEDGSRGAELSLYFLDLRSPERFFGYLQSDISEISHWFYPNADFEHFLKTPYR